MLVHHLGGSTSEWCLAGHHYPERYAKGVEVRPAVQGQPSELFGAGKFWCSDKTSWRRNCALETWFSDRLRESKINNFCRDSAVILQAHHDVTRLDIPVDKVLFVNCGQSASHLRRNFQRQLYLH